MHNIKKISTLHAKLWRYHDEKKWDELEYFSKEFLISLGNSEVLAAELAPLVKETFLISDMAEKCKDERKFNQEDKKYKQIKHIFENIYIKLNQNKKVAKYKVKWIYYSRHKNKKTQMLLNLFLEYLALFSIRRILLVIKLTWISTKFVYPSHKKHDWEALEKAFYKYWKEINKSLKEPKVLPPQF